MSSDLVSSFPEWIKQSFPKVRPALPPRYQAIYFEEYKYNRGPDHGRTLKQRLESWMHAQAADTSLSGPILEIGAGTLNHVPYEPAHPAYDIVEPFTALYAGSVHRSRIRHSYDSVHSVSPDQRYVRIIAIAVLEHVRDLPDLVARTALLLDEQGEFTAGIPSEGGLLWYLAWRLGTGVSFWLRRRLDYRVLMRHEHVNRAGEIGAIIGLFFDDVTIHRFPTPWHHLSFYASLRATHPRKRRAEAWLADRGRTLHHADA
jgi:hypothetical protein